MMPKKIDYTLTTEQLHQIETLIQTHPKLKVQNRGRMIRLLHLGKTPNEVANILMTTATTVYNWHERWRTEGINGLDTRAQTGRPKAGGQEYIEQLDALIQTEPSELGFGFNVWTSERLLDHLEQLTGVRVSEKTLRNRLKEMDYVYRRPKHVLTNLQDKTAKKQVDDLLQELKKERKQEKSSYSLWTRQQ